jgi:threonine dehydrogenase-like Zn-dependent dehydrogenase
MKAIAVDRVRSGGARLIDVPHPSIDDIPNGRGVLVRVLHVGVDGTDKEIIAGEYGTPPSGDDYLITGHESFGVVEAVGSAVREFAPGDYVVATVRRRGSSLYDTIGTYDMTTDDQYFERGINLRHGYLAEYYADDAEYIVKVPPGLRDVGVLVEPTSVIEKGIAQAYEIQRRLRVWRPKVAIVLGAGTVGLLAAMALRLRGLEVHVFARDAVPNRNATLVTELGAQYHATSDRPFIDAARDLPPAISFSRRPASHHSSSMRWKYSGRTACSFSRASPVATAISKCRPTASILASSSATRSWSAR